jgi:hypothetical protein
MTAKAVKIVLMRLWRMNQIPELYVMSCLFSRQCVQSLLRSDNRESSHQIKHLTGKTVPGSEQEMREIAPHADISSGRGKYRQLPQ